MDTLVLEHHDGHIDYALERGGFDVSDGRLFVSLEARAVDADAFPAEFRFAITGLPVGGPLTGQTLGVSAGDDDSPRAHVYTTFHAMQVAARLEVHAADDAGIDVSLEVVSDDPVYYDQRARPTLLRGRCRLPRRDHAAMWLPD